MHIKRLFIIIFLSLPVIRYGANTDASSKTDSDYLKGYRNGCQDGLSSLYPTSLDLPRLEKEIIQDQNITDENRDKETWKNGYKAGYRYGVVQKNKKR